MPFNLDLALVDNRILAVAHALRAAGGETVFISKDINARVKGDALGIPLHGQRSVYLRYALQSYQDGRRENLLDAMAEKLKLVDSDGIEALVNYYASY